MAAPIRSLRAQERLAMSEGQGTKLEADDVAAASALADDVKRIAIISERERAQGARGH